jgi:hypothetical protein
MSKWKEMIPDTGINEIILYQPDNAVKLEVRLENETVWLNRQQIALLFDRDVKTIGKHINNALHEELTGFATVANFATVQFEGERQVEQNIDGSLDIGDGYKAKNDELVAVGYRAASIRQLATAELDNTQFLYVGFTQHREILHHCSQIEERFALELPAKYRDILPDAKTLENIFLDCKEQDKSGKTLTKEIM